MLFATCVCTLYIWYDKMRFPVMYLGNVPDVGSRQVEDCSASLKAFILLSSDNVTPDFMALTGFSH